MPSAVESPAIRYKARSWLAGLAFVVIFGWTIEMQIKATRAGLRCLEIPVPYRRRIGQSKISGTISGVFKAGTKILWTIAKYGILSRRKPDRKRTAM